MRQNTLIAIAVITVTATAGVWLVQPVHHIEATTKLIDTSTGERRPLMNTVEPLDFRKAPVIISGDSIYIAWPTNDTDNDDVI
jgi:hypothetical protein